MNHRPYDTSNRGPPQLAEGSKPGSGSGQRPSGSADGETPPICLRPSPELLISLV